MKNKLKIIFVIALCLMLSCIFLVACKNDKTEDIVVKPAKTEEVASYEDLLKVSAYVGKEYSQYTIKLTADIDLTGKDWKPIGSTLDKAFTGIFDGNGHTIKGLSIKGWDSDGTPLYIPKKIIGWLNDGTPVYQSSEIIEIKKGDVIEEGKTEVKKIVREGNDDDPNYVKIADGNGYFEKSVSYGSVGLFGYTNGATVKNLTISDADISFYAPDDIVYAGIVSGYDVASEFSDITVSNGKIAISSIYSETFTYADFYGTPNMTIRKNTSGQYVGGVLGYAKSNSVRENDAVVVKNTKLNNINSNDFVFDNTNYSTFYSGQFSVFGQGKDAKLIIDESKKKGYNVSNVQSDIANGFSIETYETPLRLYSGGVAGYLDGAIITEANVDGYNKAEEMSDGYNITKGAICIVGQAAYVGGISGCIYNTTAEKVNAQNVFVNTVSEKGLGLLANKGTAAGAFALISNSKIKEGSVKGFSAEIGGNELEAVCIGGYIGYAYDRSIVENINVENMYAYSTYTSVSENSENTSDNELGSVLSGAVGVLRDARLSDAEVSNVRFNIRGGKPVDYVFTKGIVSQIYGESTFKNATASEIKNYNKDAGYDNAYTDVEPVQYKDNFVNEDGNTSARLYYFVDGKYSGVYVTVYGELVPYDENENSLIKETVYIKVDLSGIYSQGDMVAENKYYYYDAENDRYNYIVEDTQDENKKYDPKKVYALKTDVYKVQFKENNKKQTLKANTFFEYNKKTGEYKLTTDTTANPDKTYYNDISKKIIKGYYLNVTVYSESGNKIIVDPKKPNNEDDDILAESVFKLSVETVENSVKTQVCGNKEYALAEAEIYLKEYFEVGVGFKKDINGFKIKYFDDSEANRDFSKYALVDGRPIVENISYKND